MSNGAILCLMGVLFLAVRLHGRAGDLRADRRRPGRDRRSRQISMQSMIGQLFHGIDSEALLAVPFFLLVGELMASSDVVHRMIRLSQTLVGHLRGGLAQVVTLFSMFFAGISGSSVADVAVLSRTIAPGDGQGRLRPRLHRGADRVGLDDGEPDSAQHHGGGVRRHRQRLDRRPVPRRRRPRRADRRRTDGLQLFLGPGRREEAARAVQRSRRRGARLGAAAGDPGDHHGRDTVRLVHADRGRHGRRRLHPDRADPDPAAARTSSSCRATSCTRACLYSLPLAAVAAASAFGWMVAYLRGPDIVAELHHRLAPAPAAR